MNNANKIKNKIAFSGGIYSVAVSAVVLAILVAVNFLMSALPATITKLDISSSKLYSITSNTKVVVNSLEKDVTIYWIVQADEEDSIIENLLAKYESLSSHISVVKRNPDVYPTFAAQYTDEAVKNNSLIVECGDKFCYISYDSIYVSDIDYTTYSISYSFDGEGAITSAIDYAVSDDLPQIYVLEGHGETELPNILSEQIEKDNMELNMFSLLNDDAIPEEADCILIYAPSSDISKEEQEILAEYVSNGGKLFVMAGTTVDGTLTNLYGLLENYGITAAEGVVIENDRSYYALGYPYVLLPDIQSHRITEPLISSKYRVIVPTAQGLIINATANAAVTELLSSSNTAFSKIAGYSLNTYEKEDGDIDGAFSLAVSIEDNGGGQIVWIPSSDFLTEIFNAYSSGANLNFAMNALSSLIGESEALAIRSKSLGYNYLTISDSTASKLKIVMIGVLPLAFIAAGIGVTIVRRRIKNG